MATTTVEAYNDTYSKDTLMLLDAVFNTSSLSTDDISFTSYGLVSDELYYAFTIVNYVILCVSVSLFGIVANSINILVFIRQGFKETITISFFGMAVSDLILQIMTLWVCVCFNPWFETARTPFRGGDVLYFIGGWIQVITTRVTSWITAFVTLERCLCIIMPLKVKDIITITRTKVVIGTIFVASSFCVIPVYFTIDIQWIFDSRHNRSLLTLVDLESRRGIQSGMFYFNNVASPLGSFAVVVICTILLSISINRTAKWRSKFSANEESKMKDQKVVTMVTLIAGVYIVCYTPTIGIFIWMVEDPQFSVTGRYRNLFLLLSSFAFLLESVNSSMNIFIYYIMSSKYRVTFRSILTC